MPVFKNTRELGRFFGQGDNATKFMMSQPEMVKMLKSELKRLEQYIKEELQKYFDSYEPTVYVRTGDTMRSITLSEPYLDGDSLCAEITFDEGLANHPSVMGRNQPDGYTPHLLQEGWSISASVQPRVAYFTDHPGSNYLLNAIARFNADNKYGLKVTAYYNGEPYR